MIGQIHICRCDICGAVAEAKEIQHRGNDIEYTYPDGWHKSRVTAKVHICPECSTKLNMED